ncbi:hypothetical protein PFFCH_05764 [Plasmodium falciparum FCH/4]|uniref:Uncharacterized protein n=1 Tax=Plasmodium falciparum FCH/4 TaxID=1036724 RepID=A0A024VEU7_PLAFA|nr:hypothetical protein PFFCH_05764 [Plasmodium falciparum FCH/4]
MFTHAGESAIIFLMGCVVLMGVSFWATYTSYGIACLPLSLLQQRNIDHDKKEIENRFMSLKEKEIMIKVILNILIPFVPTNVALSLNK